MEIGMSNVELIVFGLTALLVAVVAAVARRGQPHLLPREPAAGAAERGPHPAARQVRKRGSIIACGAHTGRLVGLSAL